MTHSQYLGHCTPSPTAIDPASPVKAANVFHPARITMVSGAGVPDNTFVGSWDAGTLAMAAGADNHNVGFTDRTAATSSGSSRAVPSSTPCPCPSPDWNGGDRRAAGRYELLQREYPSHRDQHERG